MEIPADDDLIRQYLARLFSEKPPSTSSGLVYCSMWESIASTTRGVLVELLATAPNLVERGERKAIPPLELALLSKRPERTGESANVRSDSPFCRPEQRDAHSTENYHQDYTAIENNLRDRE